MNQIFNLKSAVCKFTLGQSNSEIIHNKTIQSINGKSQPINISLSFAWVFVNFLLTNIDCFFLAFIFIINWTSYEGKHFLLKGQGKIVTRKLIKSFISRSAEKHDFFFQKEGNESIFQKRQRNKKSDSSQNLFIAIDVMKRSEIFEAGISKSDSSF